jgi:hypothetical protein
VRHHRGELRFGDVAPFLPLLVHWGDFPCWPL